MGDIPEATAAEAQAAAHAAKEAEQAAAAAIANSAAVAAAAEQAAAEKVEKVAGATGDALSAFGSDISWLKENQEQTRSTLGTLTADNQALRQQVTELHQGQQTMAEALKALLTPKPSAAEAKAETPEEIPTPPDQKSGARNPDPNTPQKPRRIMI